MLRCRNCKLNFRVKDLHLNRFKLLFHRLKLKQFPNKLRIPQLKQLNLNLLSQNWNSRILLTNNQLQNKVWQKNKSTRNNLKKLLSSQKSYQNNQNCWNLQKRANKLSPLNYYKRKKTLQRKKVNQRPKFRNSRRTLLRDKNQSILMLRSRAMPL